MIITRNEWTCLLILPWISTGSKLVRRLSSFPLHKTSSFNKTFSTMPVCRIASAKNENSAFTGSYTKNQLWYQKFDLRQNAIPKAC